MSRSNKTSYADSGVSIKRGDQLVDIIKPLAKTTFRKEIIGSIGGFAAASALPKKYKNPVLISCTDGVGTKIEIAEAMKVYDSIGIDLGINTFDVISPSLPMSSKRAESISWFIYFLVNNLFMICVISQI